MVSTWIPGLFPQVHEFDHSSALNLHVSNRFCQVLAASFGFLSFPCFPPFLPFFFFLFAINSTHIHLATTKSKTVCTVS